MYMDRLIKNATISQTALVLGWLGTQDVTPFYLLITMIKASAVPPWQVEHTTHSPPESRKISENTVRLHHGVHSNSKFILSSTGLQSKAIVRHD